MKRFIPLVIVLFTLTACGEKGDKYTASCKEIGNTGSEVQSCAKEMRAIEKEMQNWEEPK